MIANETSFPASISFAPDAITVSGSKGEWLARLKLCFSIGTHAYRVVALEAVESGYLGRTDDAAVTVSITACSGGICVELVGDFSATDQVSYFTGSTVNCLYGRAFVPDADCRVFETDGREDFYLSNSGMILQKQVKKSDLWMIAPPPHVLSFGEDGRGWFGVSIPEPMPVSHTRIQCQKRAVSLSFHDYSPSHDAGRLPRVYLHVDMADSKMILDRHCATASALGLLQPTKQQYDWWHNPVYCTWGDQCYLQKTAPRNLEDAAAIPLDEAMIMGWADQIRDIYAGEVNYIIDAGWFSHLGDYDPKLPTFESVDAFREVLVRLKAKGFRVILWYTPFWVGHNSMVEAEHPEYLLRRRDGSIYRDDDKRGFLDFSNPAVRDFTERRVEYLLKTLDADGFKIDMNYVHPLMSDVLLHDASWGHGNHLWLQVLKFFHQAATTIKADAFFTISGIESYLQPYASSVRLNDLFDYDHAQAWYDRAEMVARLMPDMPIDVDGWPASLTKMREYQFVSPVFGAPVTYYIDAVDVMRTPLAEVERNRMASVWTVYGKVPCAAGMQLTIDADTDRFERRDAQGRLCAVALQKSAFVAYADDRIYVTANCDRAVSLPVPEGSVFSKAERVSRDGQRESVPFYRDGDHLILNVQDASCGILAYELILGDS